VKRLIRAGLLIDGDGSVICRDGALLIDGSVIAAVGPAASVQQPAEPCEKLEFPQGAIMPGLIDCHAHLTFGTGDRSYETIMEEDSDEVMVIRGIRNCGIHLRAGVTTVRDCGARNATAQTLRDAAKGGVFESPRLLVSGPPITPTRGHFWFCNGEADGVDGVRQRARTLIAQGVDVLKIMASGGGTRGTDPAGAAYSAHELAAAVEEGHRADKRVVAHCLSAASVVNAIEAGVDSLEHINFIQPDGSRRMDEPVAQRIVDKQVVVSPTIQTGYRRLQKLKAQASRSPAETAQMHDLDYKLETKLSFVSRLHQAGARIVAATDAIEEFGDFALGLVLLTQAGMSPLQAIRAATSEAAEALAVSDRTGALRPNKEADLLVVDGNPSVDIRRLSSPLLVVRAGAVVFRAATSTGAAGQLTS
jgi:imidazolonepropionase-like amidohydrolase